LLDFGKQYTYFDRNEIVTQLNDYLENEKYYEVVPFGATDYRIVFNMPVGDRGFLNKQSFASSEEAHWHIQTVCEHLKKQSNLLDAFFFFVKHSQESPTIPDSFYNLSLSIIFPAWTARFADLEFRNLVEMTVSLNLPAHIDHQKCIFLGLDEMAAFEHLYYAWTEEKASAKPLNDVLDNLAAQLTQLLWQTQQEN